MLKTENIVSVINDTVVIKSTKIPHITNRLNTHLVFVTWCVHFVALYEAMDGPDIGLEQIVRVIEPYFDDTRCDTLYGVAVAFWWPW